jgi:hypothetical protein
MLPLGAFNGLIFFKNGLKTRKLCPPYPNRRAQALKKNTEHYKF